MTRKTATSQGLCVEFVSFAENEALELGYQFDQVCFELITTSVKCGVTQMESLRLTEDPYAIEFSKRNISTVIKLMVEQARQKGYHILIEENFNHAQQYVSGLYLPFGQFVK